MRHTADFVQGSHSQTKIGHCTVPDYCAHKILNRVNVKVNY